MPGFCFCVNEVFYFVDRGVFCRYGGRLSCCSGALFENVAYVFAVYKHHNRAVALVYFEAFCVAFGYVCFECGIVYLFVYAVTPFAGEEQHGEHTYYYCVHPVQVELGHVHLRFLFSHGVVLFGVGYMG